MVNLHLIGFSEAATNSLGIALRNRAQGVCTLSDVHSADVALVDLDETRDQENWRNLPQDHGLELIATSKDDQVPPQYEKEFSYFIKKPLRFSELLTSVSQAAKSNDQKALDIKKASTAGSQVTDGERLRLSKVSRTQDLIDPARYLLGRVLSALHDATDENIRLLQWWSEKQWLVLDRDRNRVISNVGEQGIRRVAIMTLENLGIQERWIKGAQLDVLRTEANWECTEEEFVWLLTLYTVRTGGLNTLELDTPFRLSRWPNLARYSSSDKDLPLASCWVDTTCSVRELAAKMRLPLEQVLPFASCCLAIRFLQKGQSRSEKAVEPVNKKGLKRLLSMILGKLAK